LFYSNWKNEIEDIVLNNVKSIIKITIVSSAILDTHSDYASFVGANLSKTSVIPFYNRRKQRIKSNVISKIDTR